MEIELGNLQERYEEEKHFDDQKSKSNDKFVNEINNIENRLIDRVNKIACRVDSIDNKSLESSPKIDRISDV